MSKKNIAAQIIGKSIDACDKECTAALEAYRAVKNDVNAKASALTLASSNLEKAISAYNDRVLGDKYAGFRASDANSFMELFVAGTWEKRRYSQKDDALVSSPVRYDVLDFIKASETLGAPVGCSKTRLTVALEALVAAIKQRVMDELSQSEDVHVSIGEIVKKLQAVMDVLEVPEFELNGKKVNIYARPKDARFLCACATKASRKLGKVEVIKSEKIAAYVTDVYYAQVNHEEYTVEA